MVTPRLEDKLEINRLKNIISDLEAKAKGMIDRVNVALELISGVRGNDEYDQENINSAIMTLEALSE